MEAYLTLIKGRWSIVCKEHGERHNDSIVRYGDHISNTGLYVDYEGYVFPAKWLEQALKRHNAEKH